MLPRYARLPATVALTAVVADQALTVLARRHLFLTPGRHPIMADVVWLEYVRNPGAAFGLGGTWSGVALVAPLLSLGALLVLTRLWRQTHAQDRRRLLLLALLAAGVTGNALTRLRYGAVIDYLVLAVGDAVHVACNAADLLIVSGIAGLIAHRRRHGAVAPAVVALSRLRPSRW